MVFPQCVVASAFKIFNKFLVLIIVFCLCLAYVSLGSSERPTVFGLITVESV